MTMMMLTMISKDYVEWAKKLAAQGRAMTLEESLARIDEDLKKASDPCTLNMLNHRRELLINHFKSRAQVSSKKDLNEKS